MEMRKISRRRPRAVGVPEITRCFEEDGKEMYKDLYRMCTPIDFVY